MVHMSALYLAASAAAQPPDDDGNGALLIAVVSLATALGYIGSLYKNPWRKCHACKGDPGRSGAVFWWARGQCDCCKDSGRAGHHLRWGRYLVFGHPDRPR
jgi:hypothetical protein